MPIQHLPLPLLASASASPAVEPLSSSSDPISFQTALLVIIAGALVFLAKNLASLNQRLSKMEAGDPGPGTAPLRSSAAALQSSTASSHGGASLDTVAAIVAAVHATLGSNHRVLRIGPANHERQAWSMEGRRQVFHSHKVR